MSRPAISVVMPFAGTAAQARAALATLHGLRTESGDELILVDNCGVGVAADRVAVVRALEERSPAHARNAGAARSHGEWILFLDADCLAPADLLERYFIAPVDAEVGALAGEVVPAPGARGLAERYGAQKSFLSQRAHLAHRYLPRAAAANLLVRRSAFEQLGGFYEGLLAAEDTDFSWRLQQAGWRLELRAAAHVEHRYRGSVRALRRQWRGYAAGRAWLSRRYPGFRPEPGAARALRRLRSVRPASRTSSPPPVPGVRRRSRTERLLRAARLDPIRFVALDAILAGEELAGLALSNRPAAGHSEPAAALEAVLVFEHFPARGDPLVDFAATLRSARVEAAARPDAFAQPPAASGLRVDYREDAGELERATALVALLARHPLRCARDRLRLRGEPGAPRLADLAPAAIRLGHDPLARVHALGAPGVRVTAQRLAALAGRHCDPHPPRP